MTGAAKPSRLRGLQSIAAILAAAAVATLLSPVLFYACTMPVWPDSPMAHYDGPLGPLDAAIYAVKVAPHLLVALFAAAVVAGGVLNLLRLRHAAVYLLAGAAVSLAAAFLAPLIVGDVEAMMLAPELDSLHLPAVLAATAAAGLLDGAVFWLIVRHFH